MMKQLRRHWIQLILGIALALAVGVGISPLLLPSPPELITIGDRAIVTSGDATETIKDGRRLGAFDDVFEEDLPLTAAAAVAAGWKDPVLCAPGRGRYFSPQQGGAANPYLLMYENAHDLIGVYLYSGTEMPAPWYRLDELRAGGQTPIVDYEHWGLFVYFQDPTRACTKDRASSAGGATGGASYYAPHAVQSYPESTEGHGWTA